jgi:hypothetical protein
MGAILAMLVTPWRAGGIVERPPRRVRYFVLVGLLWFPALVGGGSLGRALQQRFELPAPQANLMATVAFGVVSHPLPAWRIVVGAAAWLVGSIACGAVVVGLGGAILGALLRDRPLGLRLGAVASLYAPIFAFASGVALSAEVVLVHGQRDWLATAIVAALALWPVVGWGVLAAAADRRAARPRLPPAWCAAGFAIASIVVLRVASEALALPLVVVRWLVD